MQVSFDVGFKPLGTDFTVYGVPYMGNKRGIAKDIYNFIASRHDVGTLVEPFCGGFSIGSTFLRNGWTVIANDYNKYTYALLSKTIFDGLPENLAEDWISREKFNDIKTSPDNYDDWYVGYVSQVWSFGNMGISGAYLFGVNSEELKRVGHLTVTAPTITERRLALKQLVRLLKSGRHDLERLERLEQLERLELHNVSYERLEIPYGAIVYCDPPYENTAKYHKDVDHMEFWEWVRGLSETNPVYVSSYKAPEDFASVWSKDKRVTLSSSNRGMAREHLFKLGRHNGN